MLAWGVLGLVVVGGVGAGAWFFLNRKSRLTVASLMEPSKPTEPPRKQPPAKTKA